MGKRWESEDNGSLGRLLRKAYAVVEESKGGGVSDVDIVHRELLSEADQLKTDEQNCCEEPWNGGDE
jgi:hypothetical protein